MKKPLAGLLAICLAVLLAVPVSAALPADTGMITDHTQVSGREFSANSSIAAKLDKMFAGDIGLYKDQKKTKLVNAALGTRNVPNNGVWQYWGPDPRAGTSCFAYANAFYATFYDDVYPHHRINSNHTKVKATGKISYNNFVKWGVRDDAPVYIREGNHSIIVLHYDKDYLTYVDGNGDGKGLIAIRKEAWTRGRGANLYNQKPSLIVQPTKAYFPAGSMGPVPCTEGGSNHDWDQAVLKKAASCKETGLKVYTCRACQRTREETLPKTSDHQYGAWSVTTKATCTKAGKQTAQCEICGKKKTKTQKSLGHDYGETVPRQQATLFSAGVQVQTCSRCSHTNEIKTDCIFREELLGITLTTREGVFLKNTRIVITTPQEGTEKHSTIGRSLQGITGKFIPYVWDVRAWGERAAAKGKVTVTFTVPQDFGNNLALYAVTGDTAQALTFTRSADGRVLTVELDGLPTLALCDLDVPWEPEPTEPPTQPETQPMTEPATQSETLAAQGQAQGQSHGQMYLVLICAAAVLLLGGGVTTVIVFVKKRKAAQLWDEVPEDIYL